MHHVDYARHGAAAVITFSTPPANSISYAVRSALLDVLDCAATDEAVRAIVLASAGSLFSGGADIREFGTPAARAAPQLRDVIAACEASAKPVIAAIGGLASVAASSSRSAATTASRAPTRASACPR